MSHELGSTSISSNGSETRPPNPNLRAAQKISGLKFCRCLQQTLLFPTQIVDVSILFWRPLALGAWAQNLRARMETVLDRMLAGVTVSRGLPKSWDQGLYARPAGDALSLLSMRVSFPINYILYKQF
jgi:hypothetical protein